MHSEYEIPAAEYAASQLLYYKLRNGHKRFARAAGWRLPESRISSPPDTSGVRIVGPSWLAKFPKLM